MAKISSSRMDMEEGRLDDAVLKQYGETVVGGASGASAGSSYEIDVANGNVFNLTLNSANCTLTFVTPAASGTMSSFTVILRQDGVGGRTVTWPTVKWPGGTTPALSTAAHAVNVLTFFTLDAGSTWFGVRSGAQFQSPNVLLAWGRNNQYQLGRGDTVDRSSPVQVGTLATWSQISPGLSHTAAVKTDGTLWTWGLGTYGRLGHNNTTSHSTPVQVGTLTNWAQVSAAGYRTAAVKTDGTLWAWGVNANGQLGDNTNIIRSSPVQIGTLTTWSQVSVGGNHTAAIKTDGTLWTWGINSNGVNAHSLSPSSPVQVGALTNWSRVSAGEGNFDVAIKTDGTLWAWGGNSFGQLGDNTIINRSSPVQVGALTDWAQASAGGLHIAAVKTDGTLWAWGYNGVLGLVGDNTAIRRSSPVQVGTLTDWSQVACGDSHTAAVKTDSTLWTWGASSNGQLGHNNTTTRSSPVQVGTLAAWVDVSAGRLNTFARQVVGP